MSRTNAIVLALIALFVGLGVWLVAGGTSLFGRVESDTGQDEEETDLGPVDLARDARPRDESAASDGAQELEVERGSESEREALEAPPVVDPGLPLPIRGQVLDRYGAPVPSARVAWQPQSPTDEEREGQPIEEVDPWGDPIAEWINDGQGQWREGVFVASVDARTDENGWFELADSDARRGGTLTFGFGLFSPQLPVANVNANGDFHDLVFPARGQGAPRLIVELSDADDGSALMPDHFELDLVALGSVPEGEHPEWLEVGQSFRLTEHPRDVYLALGQAGADRLSPGTWRFTVRAANSAWHTQEVVVPFDGDDVRVELALETYEGVWVGSGFDERGVDALAPDTELGFADYPGDRAKWRPIGERRADLQFLHTLRGFGTGPVSGAVLEIEMEAASGMAHNDSINLEYRGEAGFAWGSRISAVASSGQWNTGTRETLFIDLGALTSREGHPPLLELLEDGALDVYVQDDTAVYGLELHIIP